MRFLPVYTLEFFEHPRQSPWIVAGGAEVFRAKFTNPQIHRFLFPRVGNLRLDFVSFMKQDPSANRAAAERNDMQWAGQNRGEPQSHAFSEDATERKRTEEALRKSEERWRSVFENSAIGVALTDLTGRFLATNPTYQKMLGYTEEEFQTVSFLEITHEDYREANWALVSELLEGKREQFQIEKQYRRKDGSLIWVRNNVSLVPGTESMPRFIMALSEDITERKEAEEALLKSEERVRLILDSAAEAIFGCDPHGTCLFCNRAAVRL